MTYYLVKLFVSAGIIVLVSEIAKFNVGLGALLKALPLVSILAMVWLYVDTADTQQVGALAYSTFWLVLPTLPMFLVLPALLQAGWTFYPALAASIAVMALCYLVALPLLARVGVTL